MIRIVPFLLLAALAGPVAAQENLAAAAPQFTVTADNPVPATTVVPVQRPAVQVGERTVIDDRSTRGMTRGAARAQGPPLRRADRLAGAVARLHLLAEQHAAGSRRHDPSDL